MDTSTYHQYNRLKAYQDVSGLEILIVPIQLNGHTYYRTIEACRKTGISRATLFRWLKVGLLEKSYLDRRGWRLFTEDDLSSIRAEVHRIEVKYNSRWQGNERH
ncbi:MerR family transcriptional regulator [Chloroflexota bacterium]